MKINNIDMPDFGRLSPRDSDDNNILIDSGSTISYLKESVFDKFE